MVLRIRVPDMRRIMQLNQRSGRLRRHFVLVVVTHKGIPRSTSMRLAARLFTSSMG